MSKNDRPPSLLRNVPSRDNIENTKLRATSKKRSRTPEKEVDISAPPVSSSEEDEPNPVAKAGKRGKSPLSSGDESPDRADIRPAFPSSLNSTASISNRSKTKYGSSQRSQQTYGSARSSQDSKPSSSQRSRNAKDSRDDELGSTKGGSLLPDPDKKFTRGKGTKPPSPRVPRQKRTKKMAKGKYSGLLHAGLILRPCVNRNAV